MKYIITITLAMLVLGLGNVAFAAKTEWPAEVEIREAQLNVVGYGVRRKLMMPLYDIALYTQTGDASETVVTDNEPKALRIVVTSTLVSTALFTEAVLDGYKKYDYYDEVSETVKGYLADFDNIELVEGDVYTVFNDPIEGLVTYHNGEVISIINDRLFADGMFNIWLGPTPVNRRLKSNLRAD